MITHVTKHETLNNLGALPKITLSVAPEALDLMIETLVTSYNDPELAVMRELMANAKDAHFVAGKAHKPFWVHVPCKQYPIFTVRDEGGGRNDEEFKKYFGGIGASDKRDTDLQIGGFGVGVKCPYGCSQAYQIINRHNGVKVVYLCTKDEDDHYCMLELERGPNDDLPEGVELQIPIKVENVKLFQEKLAKVWRYMAPAPQFDWISEEERDAFAPDFWAKKPEAYKEGTIEVLVKGDKKQQVQWRLCPEEKESKAVLSGIEYIVRWTDIGFTEKDEAYLSKYHLVSDVGFLPMTFSREHIKLTQRAKTVLQEIGQWLTSEKFKSCLFDGNADWLTRGYIEHHVLHIEDKWNDGVKVEEWLRKDLFKIDAVTWTGGQRDVAYLSSVYVGEYVFTDDKQTNVNYRQRILTAALRDMFDEKDLSLLQKVTTRMSGLLPLVFREDSKDLTIAKKNLSGCANASCILVWPEMPAASTGGQVAIDALCKAGEETAAHVTEDVWVDYNKSGRATCGDLLHQLFGLMANGMDVLIVKSTDNIPLNMLPGIRVYNYADIAGRQYSKYEASGKGCKLAKYEDMEKFMNDRMTMLQMRNATQPADAPAAPAPKPVRKHRKKVAKPA